MAETPSKRHRILRLRNQIHLHPFVQTALKHPLVQNLLRLSLRISSRRSGRSTYQQHFLSASIAGMLCMAIFAQGDMSPRTLQANLWEITKPDTFSIALPQLELQVRDHQLEMSSSRPFSPDTRAFIFKFRVDPTRAFTGTQVSSARGTIDLSFKGWNQRTLLLKKLPESTNESSSLFTISDLPNAQTLVRDSPLMIDKQGTTLLRLKTPLDTLHQ